MPPAGHYCLISVLSSPSKPALSQAEMVALTEQGRFDEMIRGYNNISWRNMNVVNVQSSLRRARRFKPEARNARRGTKQGLNEVPEPPEHLTDYFPVHFIFAPDPARKPEPMQLEVICEPGLPAGLHVKMYLHDERIMKHLRQALPAACNASTVKDHQTGTVYTRLDLIPDKDGTARIPEVDLVAKPGKTGPYVWLQVPFKANNKFLKDFTVIVRHLRKGKLIGGITWLIRPQE